MAEKEIVFKAVLDTKDIKKGVDKAEKSLKNFKENTKESFSEAKEGVSELSSSLGSLGAPLSGAADGVGKLGSAFKALLANPVVAILALIAATLKAVYEAFTRTEDGANKVSEALAFLSGLMQPLIVLFEDIGKWIVKAFEDPQQAIKDFGQFIIDNIINRFTGMLELIPNLAKAVSLLFKGEFSEAAKVATDSAAKMVLGVEDATEKLKKMGEEAKESADALLALQKAENQLNKDIRENNVLLSEQLKERERLMNIRDDEFNSIQRRIAANEELNRIEKEQLERSKEIAAQRILNIQNRIKETGDSKDLLEELSEAQVEYNNILADSLGRENEYLLNRRSLYNEQIQAQIAQIEFEKQRAQIRAQSELSIYNLEVKAFEDKLALLRKESQEYKDLQREKILYEEQYRKDSAVGTEDLEQMKVEVQKASIDEIVAYTEEKAQEQVNIIQQTNEKIAEIQNNAITQSTLQALESGVNITNSLLENARTDIDSFLQSQSEIIEAETSKQEAVINSRLERGLISEAQAAQQREKIAADELKKKEKLEKDAFEKKKKLDIQQALMNGALAVTNALATTQPFIPAGIIASVTAASLAAVQVQTIKNRKFAKGGILDGASHANGGIPTQYGELEGGEAVINKRSTKMFAPLLSEINQMGGGVKFENGGVLGNNTSSSTSTSSDNSLTGLLTKLDESLNKPSRSYVVESDISGSQDRINSIEARATI